MASITTDTQIKKAIKTRDPKKAAYFGIGGYRGLRLRIRGDYVEFQHRYTQPISKERVEMTLGDYNKGFTLEHARQAHRDNLALLAKSIDPKTHRDQQNAKQAFALKNTFEAIANDWLTEQTSHKGHTVSKSTLEDWQNYLALLIGAFGKYPIQDIKPPQLIRLFKEIQKTYINKGNRIGFYRKENDCYYFHAALFEREVCLPFDKKQVAQTLLKHEVLEKNHGFQLKVNSTDRDKKGYFYCVKGAILTLDI